MGSQSCGFSNVPISNLLLSCLPHFGPGRPPGQGGDQGDGQGHIRPRGVGQLEKWSQIMAEFFTADMIYDTNWSPDNTMNNSTGIWEWWENEHIPYNMAFDNTAFNQMIFAAEETTATTTTYANTRWKG